MEYKETRKLLMGICPSIFLNESDVIHHLFFTNGNGYYWENGELVSMDQYPEKLSGTEILRSRIKQRKYRLRTIEYFKLNPESPIIKSWFLHSDGKSIGSFIYPLCQYSEIVNLPDNIKPDWLHAAICAIKLARSSLFRITKDDEDWLSIADVLIAKIAFKNSKNKPIFINGFS